MKKYRSVSMFLRLCACMLALCLLPAFAAAEAGPDIPGGDWVNFILLCNEGMNNSGGNAGNTMMVIGMNPSLGRIRLMMFTWDTFVDYEGYDVPQKIDMPYRNSGPEETVKVFNDNFGLGITHFMSLNYLNLASLIDTYGGVDLDVSRAERNALNGMVASKHQYVQAQADAGLLTQILIGLLADEYYLNDFGPETHLNGLQSVAFGWLQYDSVYNCCQREVEVIAGLFKAVGTTIRQEIAFCTNETGLPENTDGKRVINLDDMSDEDLAFLREALAPIFQMAVHNLTEEEIMDITVTLARVALAASRQGVDIFDENHVQTAIFPLEALEEYDIIAGAKGHLADKEANAAAMKEFLYGE